jgi:TRAP-type mannitol/chloroaromatic compound transport system substrate-binding protein
MRSKNLKKLISISLVALAAGMLTAAPAVAKEKHTWRIQTLWQPGTANQEAFERFAKNVRKKTDGQINIIPLPVGSVVGVTETLDAVKRGILQGQHPATVYWTGRDPAFAVLGDLNAAYEDPRQAMEYFYEHGGLELLREAYKPYGLYAIGGAWWGVESIPTTRRVASPDDIKGLKIRLPQGMASDLFAKFGAVPVNLPGSEVFSAMDSGTIEATDWGTLAMNAELGFHDEAKYAIYPGIHSMPVGDVSIPLETWNSLTGEQQEILHQAVRDFSMDMIETLEKQDQEAAKKLEAKGVELVSWSAEDRKRFREAAVDTWREYGKKNDLARRAVESQIKFLRSKGLLD